MRVIFSAFLLLLTMQVNAEQSTSPLSSIRVTGQSTITANPDRAQIDIGVETHAEQSQAAATQNATRLTAALAALRKAVGSSGEIKTSSYSLNPEYEYHPNGVRTLKGYVANNVVHITLNDLSKVGSVIDAATDAGANEVQDVRFTLSDQQAVRAQALREAVLRAKADAGVLAAALDLKVLRILMVDSSDGGGPFQRIVPMAGHMAAAKAPTPIEPGTIDVTASVTLTVEVGTPAR
jgi:uncharacterized protein YggE